MQVDQLTLPQQGRVKYVTGLSFIRFAADMGTVLDPTDWTIDKGVYRTAVNTLARIYFTLSLPRNGTLTNVDVVLKGAAGHGSLGLMSMPTGAIYSIDKSTGTKALLATNADPSADATAYQALHVIPITVSHVVDSLTYRYVVDVTTEDSTGALSGADYLGCVVTVTPDTAPDMEV